MSSSWNEACDVANARRVLLYVAPFRHCGRDAERGQWLVTMACDIMNESDECSVVAGYSNDK